MLTCLTTTKGYGYAVGGQSNSPTGSGEHQQANKGGYDYWTLLLGARRVPGPVITSFTPGLGLAGTGVVVTLTGSNFTGTSGVTFNGTAAPGFAVSNGGSTLTVTLPAGASTGPIAVTANGTGTSATAFLVPTDLIISSTQPVQGTYHNVTVTGPATGGAGVGTLSGPLTVLGTLTIDNGGTLLTACQPLAGAGSFVLAAGGTLGICDAAGISASGGSGAVQVAGPRSFSADAIYVYNGTVAQATGPGLPAQVRTLEVNNSTGLTLSQAVGVAQVLRLGTGNLTTNGRALTLLSSAAGTALVDNGIAPGGGAVLGTATVQRYVSPATFAGTGYRHFSAPIGTATVASLATPGFAPRLNAAYNVSAAPGTVVPFPTVYGYDESRLATSPATATAVLERGWVSPLALTDALPVGHGYTAHIPAGQTVQFTGPLNNGLVTRVLARSAAPAASTGWHLVGNPYPSPLDWRLVAKPAGLADALYVFQSAAPYAGSYRAFVNGLGGSPLIGSSQGFFVRVNAAGATPALAFTNAARLTTYGTEPALSRGAADPRPVVELALQDAAGNQAADAAILYFEAGATAGLDAHFDAEKLPNSTGLNLATVAGSTELAIDGRPSLTGLPLTVPLAVAVPLAGAYAFTAAQVTNFAAGTPVYLTDALTGARHRLTAGTRVAVTLAATTAPGRFALEFRPATVTGTAVAAETWLQLYPNPAHEAVRVSWAGTRPTAQLVLTDALGRAVRRQTLTGATGLLSTVGLAPGLYLLRLTAENTTLVQQVEIQ